MELDLHQLIRIFRRRWWILLLLTVVAGSSAYWSASRETPMYRATATMMVNPGAIGAGQGSTGSLNEGVALSYTYVQLINTQPVRDLVQEELGGPIRSGVSASTVQNTSLIRITAVSSDPQAAADTANAYVSGFKHYVDNQNAQRTERAREGVDAQITFLNDQIDTLNAEIDDADESELERLQQQRNELTRMVTQLETDAAYTSMQAASSTVVIESVDAARVPGAPISPDISRSTMLGAVVGLMIAIGVIALLEYLDNTVKGHTNIQHLTRSPLLASIPVSPGINPGPRQIYTMAEPKAGSSEAVRLLRTNLTFAGVEREINSITVTSSGEGEGKSTTAANLAVAFASGGKSVALIDADLRKPTLHRIFGVENTSGVTRFIADPDEQREDVSDRVALPGLTLVPSGPIPPNPSEMLVSPRFQQLITEMESEFDMVIVDTPPLLQTSDALMVGSVTDGILLMAHHGRTRVDALKNATGLIHQSGTRLIGVVVNQVDKASSTYYSGGYYGKYQASDDE